MRTFIQSAPTERAFVTDKHWQTPWHREWVHGKVQPMDDPAYGGWFCLTLMFVGFGVMCAMMVSL